MPSNALPVIDNVSADIVFAVIAPNLLVEISDASTGPENLAAVMIFPEKLPFASLATTVPATEVEPALTASVTLVDPSKSLPVRKDPIINLLVVLALTVMLEAPVNPTPLICISSLSLLAVAAFPAIEPAKADVDPRVIPATNPVENSDKVYAAGTVV